MKELDPNSIPVPDVQIVAEQQKEFTYIGALKLHPGQRVFMFHKQTGEITQLITEKNASIDSRGGLRLTQKAIVDQNYCYVVAASKKAAIKKYNKKWKPDAIK